MERILLERSRIDPAALAPALDALQAGALIVVPTETVYLLACRAERADDLSTVASRLAGEAKQGASEAPRSMWLGTPAMAEQMRPQLPLPAGKLVERYWPGPLVIRLAGQPGLPEMMVPAEPVTQAVLEQHAAPLLALELFTAEGPATDAIRAKRAVRTLFPQTDSQSGGVPHPPRVLLDSGPSSYGGPPTRLAVAAFALRELTRGPLDLRRLHQAATVRLCFVCTGNICRSPLAMAMLVAMAQRDAEAQLGTNYELTLEACSRGVAALTGFAAPPEAQEVAKRYGALAPIETHRAKQVDPAELASFDWILLATREHRAMVQRMAPELEPRLLPIDPRGNDLRDPYMEPLRVYESVGQTIFRALQKRFFEANRAPA